MVELSVIRDLVAIFGVIAGFSYYVMTVRANQKNQLLTFESRQAQLYMQLSSQFKSDTWWDHYLKIYYTNWNTYEDFIKWFSDKENAKSWNIGGAMFEEAGTLLKSGLLDIKMVATGFGGITRIWWEKNQSNVLEMRKAFQQPRMASETEYLYNELMKYMKEHPELTA